jgi:predicted enzyme related to lactoylglutathione lyase
MIGSQNAKKLAEFYEKVIQKKPDMVESGWYGFVVGSCFLSIGDHSKVVGKSKNPERVMFNFETSEVKQEFERITKLGATVVAEPYQMDSPWIATLVILTGIISNLCHHGSSRCKNF